MTAPDVVRQAEETQLRDDDANVAELKLLPPVVGGFFALAVGADTAAMLRLMGRLRPQVR
jgi:hypothetical protein